MTRTLEELQAVHAKQAAWLAAHPDRDDRRREHEELGRRIAAMKAPVSYQVDTPKWSPRQPRRVERPEGGYHVLPVVPVVSDLAAMNHAEEIDKKLDMIARLDVAMERGGHAIERLDRIIASPDSDAWDKQDAQIKREQMLTERSALWWAIAKAAGDVHAHGGYLLGAGKGEELDRLGSGLSWRDGALACVAEHMPGLLTGYPWQRLAGKAVAF